MRKPAKQRTVPGTTIPVPPPAVRHAPHHPASKATPPQGGGSGLTVPIPQKKPKPRKPPVKKAKRRKWSPGADVACCAAEAVGVLVEASGRPWSAEQTLALYFSTASDPDAGATILDTLRALCGGERSATELLAGPLRGYGLEPSPGGESNPATSPLRGAVDVAGIAAAGLILGVALPEPHAVAVTPDGTWHSWGQPFNPGDWPALVVEEAWALWPR